MYWSAHYNRLVSSIMEFYGENYDRTEKQLFEKHLYQGLRQLDKMLHMKYVESSTEFYIRATVLPVGECLKLSPKINFYFLLSASPLKEKNESITKTIFVERRERVMPFGKTGNYLEQIQAANLLESSSEEVIYVDNHGALIEASTSNILLLDCNKEIVFIPKNNPLAFKGLMLEKVISMFKKNGFQVKVENLDRSSLAGRVILFTNAVSVFRYDLTRIQINKKEITTQLNKVKQAILMNSIQGE